ncbi:MAG: phosphoserine transaminase [Phycisphaerae bacterium]
MQKPQARPRVPNFGSGPTCKRPGWSVSSLSNALVGRSHRSKDGRARLKNAIELTREVAGIPKDYLIGIMPGSDTGAFECAMWSMLGARPVTVLDFESFGQGWATDVTKQLKLEAKVLKAPYGSLPDLAAIDWNTDVVFCWNGTTSGVCIPQSSPPPADRGGLTLCDATSAVFAMPMPWDRLDATTFSWQKSLGGEAAHGMLVLSPRAVERLTTYSPKWPLPKIFRLTKGGKLIDGIFVGDTINTPSMLCVEDWLDTLNWAKNLSFDGKTGLDACIARSLVNLRTVEQFVARNHQWIGFLAERPEIRSNTSICLKVVAEWFTKLGAEDQAAFTKKVSGALEAEKVAFDVNAYRDAPPGFRFWGGPAIDPQDMAAALEWLAWAYEANRPQ